MRRNPSIGSALYDLRQALTEFLFGTGDAMVRIEVSENPSAKLPAVCLD